MNGDSGRRGTAERGGGRPAGGRPRRPAVRGRAVALAAALAAAGCGHKAAIEAARKRTEATPKDPAAWVELARAYDAAGEEESAMYAFSAAFDRHSKDLPAYRRAAALAGAFGRFREARTWAELGLWVKKDDPGCLRLAARALLSRGAKGARKAVPYLEKLGVDSLPPFEVSRDRLLLARLRYSHTGETFEVRTDISTGKARQVSKLCERIFRRYQRLMPGLKPPAAKMRIFVFDNHEDYAAVLKRYDDGMAESEGLAIYDPAGIRVIVSNQPSAGYAAQGGVAWNHRVLLHELIHVALYLTGGTRVPDWIQEGLAEYVASADPVNENFKLGHQLPDRVAELAGLLAAPLWKRVDVDDVFTSRADVTLHYALSWSFVHFLHHGQGGRYRPAFYRLLGRYAAGEARSLLYPEHFEAVFGEVSRDELTRQWRDYVAGL